MTWRVMAPMLKKLFSRKRKKPYPGDLKPGASLDEALAWEAKVRQRNEAMEQRPVRIGDEAQAERAAELLYRHLKRGMDDLSPDASRWFWLKLLWFVSWRTPFEYQKIIEKERARTMLPNGWTLVHTPRPPWIRRPHGGDEFDRGDVAERKAIPL